MAPLDEVPRPKIVSLCRVCHVKQEDADKNEVIVSPYGIAHYGSSYGATACGKDATGDSWWWPL